MIARCKQVLVLTELFTARKRSLGQGNVFTPDCDSIVTGGAVLSRSGVILSMGAAILSRVPSLAGGAILSRGCHPQQGMPSLGVPSLGGCHL